MFRWKKRDDGFEWQQYVRTTIKLRRDARREKAEQLGHQAAAGARAAGEAAGRMARGGARQLSRLAVAGSERAGDVAIALLGLAGLLVGRLAHRLAHVAEDATDVLGRPGVAGPLLLAGGISLLAGIGRIWLSGRGIDTEAATALTIGCLCLALSIGPALWMGHSRVTRLSLALPTGLPKLGTRGALACGAALLIGACGLLVVVKSGFSLPSAPGLPSMPSLPNLSFTGGETLEGRARAVAGGLLRIDGNLVRLEGIEVPEPAQRCENDSGRSWRCGESARTATARLVRGRDINCQVAKAGSDGVRLGTCRSEDADIAAELVRGGHVFAESGLMATYSDAEQEARKAKAGLWSAEAPERPAQWRARLWADAKKRAPDGCPIKGRITRGKRVYLLPWSNRYDRVRLSARRGERWFCTEEEAAAAGWSSAENG